MLDESLLCIHQVTVLRQWSLRQLVDGLVRHRVPAVAVWRDKLRECGVAEAARMLEGQGLTVTSLCAAGLVTSPDAGEARAALDDVRRAIEEAAAIRAGSLMFVAGGIDAREKSVASARARVLERLAELAPFARKAGVKLALEPLHPMVCGTRSVLSTMKLANDWCDALGAEDVFGIAVDTYAVWWDPELEAEIARAGSRICAFHVNDWLADTRDLRLDRGMMGDGVIDIPGIRRLVEAAGYKGHREVEIFSERDWWRRDPDEVIGIVKQRYQTAV
jgi:sugar phosphate isomerase/epimerase